MVEYFCGYGFHYSPYAFKFIYQILKEQWMQSPDRITQPFFQVSQLFFCFIRLSLLCLDSTFWRSFWFSVIVKEKTSFCTGGDI